MNLLNRIVFSTIVFMLLCFNMLKAQNPANLILPNQQVIPADEVKRATQSIKLQPGFKYGAGATGSKLTMQISAYPSYVAAGYDEYTTNCVYPAHTSTLVGETTGNFAVTPNGNAVYSIPLKCSPGTAGMEPNLNITYVSGGANGIMGLGWNLTGISAITRTNKNPYYDTKYESIQLGLNDVFALDGNRLMLKSGSNGSAGSTYGQETETFSTITANSQQGFGPESFKVTDKNGTVTEYGMTSDSRLTGVGGSSILAWMVNKVTDEYGNYMLYHYTQLDGELVLSSIEYTGNSSLAPYNELLFEYIGKTEKTTFYEGGQEFRKTKLLKSITARANGALVKKYILQYEFSFNTILSKITEINSDGSEMNPTTFCWNDPYDNSVMQGTQNISLYSTANANKYNTIKNTISADMNGDGFSDIITLNNNDAYEILVNPFVQNYQTNNSAGYTSAMTAANTSGYNFLLNSNVYDSDFDNNQEVYNFFNDDNDLKKYYLQKINTTGVNSTTQLPTVQISQLGSAGYLTNDIDVTLVPVRFYYDKNDYTADGNQDELIIDGENVKLASSMGNATYALDPTIMVARPIDFDGDGSLEVIVFEDQTSNLLVKVLKFNAGSFSVYYSGSISFPGNTSVDLLKLIGIGDFNGDAKADVAFLNASKSALSICFSNGSSLFAPKSVTTFTALNPGSNYNITCPDINANGINDIMITEDAGSNVMANYTSYFSAGDVFVKGPSGSGKFNDNVFQVMKYYYMVGGTKNEISKTVKTKVFEYSIDFNGDGNFDFLSIDGTNTSIVNNNTLNGNPKFITGIFTGMDKKIEIIYCNTASRFDKTRTSVYQDAYNPAYTGALMTFKPSGFVASYVKFEANGNNISYEKRYLYQGAVFHKYGKGFLGYDRFTEIDLVNNVGAETNFQWSNTNFERTNTNTTAAKYTTITGNYTGQGAITTWVYNYNAIVSENKITFQHTAVGGNRFFIAPSSVSSRNFLNSTGSQTSYTYDLLKDGNITQQLTSYGWPGSAPERTEQIDKTYQQVHNIYKPLQTKTKYIQGSNPSYDREANYTFDAAGHLAQVVNDPLLGNKSLSTVYSQFNFSGSPTKIQVSSGDILPRESQVLYDATGRFVIKTINPKNDVEEFVYDPKYGSLLQSKDISGLISKYTYDGTGRLIKSQLPDNTTNTILYEYVTGQNTFQQPAFFSKTVLNEGAPYMTTLYDCWGYELRTITENQKGFTVYTDNFYDNTGLIESSESHYQLGQNQQAGYLVNKYTKDAYLRALKTETFYKTSSSAYTSKGLVSNYNYNALSDPYTYRQGFVQKVDQNGKTIVQKNNAAGQILTVTNQVNTPTTGPLVSTGDLETSDYTYHSNGKPLSVTLSYSNISDIITHTFDYDALGNQIKLIDPTVGSVNYGYNTLGEMIHRDDANGNFDYTYDVLGRVTQKVSTTSGTSTYQYVTGNAGKNQLQKITGPNVTSELSYDYLGRPLTYKETLPASSKVFISAFEYDAYSRLAKYTYPGGYITKYVYSSNGAGIELITDDNNNTIWQHNSQTATGQITGYTYGNGIATNKDFSDLHYLKSIEHGILHKQEYIFDPLKGNLSKRTFTNYAANTVNSEAFNFDVLDRLSKSEQLNPANNTAIPNTANNITIDIKGNILQKQDAGDFNYSNPAQPYSLTQITNPTPNISPNALSLNINDIRKASKIAEAATGKEMNFTYGNDDDRIKVDYIISTVNQYSRYYQNNYEREETTANTKEWTYIYAPTGLAAVFYKPTTASAGNLLYALTDHLGSPVLLTNQSQQVQEEYSFDAWGRRRNPADWTYTGFSTPVMLHRGYTMHEHIDEFKLINMNGRIYDAVLGRFMQADNQVQNPGFLQTFNKYAYVFNNPLSYTDPTGWAGGSGNGQGGTDGADLSKHPRLIYSPVYYGTGTSIMWNGLYYGGGNFTNPEYQTGLGGNPYSTSGQSVLSGIDNSGNNSSSSASSRGGRGSGGSIKITGAGALFDTPDNAANDFGNTYNDNSIKLGREFAASIYEVKYDGQKYYSYTIPRIGTKDRSTPTVSLFHKNTHAIHTHGKYLPNYSNNYFSDTDVINNNAQYLVTPNGTLKKWDPIDGIEEIINTTQPSDPKDVDRENKIDYNDFPKNEPVRKGLVYRLFIIFKK